MFEKDDEKYILRQLSNNQIVLFLGSGFSREAKNKLDENFPTGAELGKKIWEFLKYSGSYDNTSLPEMYQAFLSAGIKKHLKKEFLENTLLSSDIPDQFNYIAIPHWFKIYSVNIDDVLVKIFRRQGRGIEELTYPNDQYAERDQSLENIQITNLHGRLPCEPEDVIFSPQQYAKASLVHQPLYGQFVYDYCTLPTIFIGTDLNEPLFERYIVAREGRFGFKELRPKSFLISPFLSPVKSDNLRNNHNVHHVVGTTNDFLLWLNSIKSKLPERREILKNTFPNLLNIYEYAEISGTSKKSIVQFAKCFNRVPKEFNPNKERSGFLQGTSPRWNDILNELDIPRTITKDILENIENIIEDKSKTRKVTLFTIVGYAGSGKSTILKRLGIMLSQQGRTVFLTYSDFLPKKDEIINVLNNINERVVLLFDNSNNALPQLQTLISSLNSELTLSPIIVLAIRTNFVHQLHQNIFPDTVTKLEFKIPNLDDQEIDNLILKLEENNLLGILNGMSKFDRTKEFRHRAHRQILIAMKEATNGKSFNDIIKDEFTSLQPNEAKTLCLCIALNTELGFSNSRQDLIGFSTLPPIEVLNFLETVLQGTIMWVGNNNRFMLRHKILADYLIKYCASPSMLKEAYIRVLSILAPELIKYDGTSKIFALYKALINHKTLYRRFKNDIELARDVYDSITEYFRSDAHFWLQYGSLEVEGTGGNLKLAENYLSQAESLSSDSNYIQNAKCNLLYRQAFVSISFEEAMEYKNKADELAKVQILRIGKEEPHIFHICCAGRYRFISKWVKNQGDKKSELLSLKSSIKTSVSLHPFDEKLKIVSDAINRAYVQLGINDIIEDPDIPDFIS